MYYYNLHYNNVMSNITFQRNEVKVEWAGEDGLNSIEEIEMLNGTVTTNQIKNDVGY